MTPTARTRLGRSMREAFMERLPLKLAALFFAIVLWLVVSAEEPTEEVLVVHFTPALDSGVVVVGEVPPVRALILGSGRELLKLYNAPPVIVRRIVGSTAPHDSTRIELGPADVDLPAGVNAVVRDVRPRYITLHLERVAPVAAADSAEPAR